MFSEYFLSLFSLSSRKEEHVVLWNVFLPYRPLLNVFLNRKSSFCFSFTVKMPEKADWNSRNVFMVNQRLFKGFEMISVCFCIFKFKAQNRKLLYILLAQETNTPFCISARYLYVSLVSSFCVDVIDLFLISPQNQAKLFIEQKKIPFPVDNQNTNEELGELMSTFKRLFKNFFTSTFFFHLQPYATFW